MIAMLCLTKEISKSNKQMEACKQQWSLQHRNLQTYPLIIGDKCLTACCTANVFTGNLLRCDSEDDNGNFTQVLVIYDGVDS